MGRRRVGCGAKDARGTIKSSFEFGKVGARERIHVTSAARCRVRSSPSAAQEPMEPSTRWRWQDVGHIGVIPPAWGAQLARKRRDTFPLTSKKVAGENAKVGPRVTDGSRNYSGVPTAVSSASPRMVEWRSRKKNFCCFIACGGTRTHSLVVVPIE